MTSVRCSHDARWQQRFWRGDHLRLRGAVHYLAGVVVTDEEWIAQAERDHARMVAANAESLRIQAAMDAFNAEFQAIWAVYCAQMSALIYRGMFDPTFCCPAGKACEY